MPEFEEQGDATGLTDGRGETEIGGCSKTSSEG